MPRVGNVLTLTYRLFAVQVRQESDCNLAKERLSVFRPFARVRSTALLTFLRVSRCLLQVFARPVCLDISALAMGLLKVTVFGCIFCLFAAAFPILVCNMFIAHSILYCIYRVFIRSLFFALHYRYRDEIERLVLSFFEIFISSLPFDSCIVDVVSERVREREKSESSARYICVL